MIYGPSSAPSVQTTKRRTSYPSAGQAAVRHRFGGPGLSDRDLVAIHVARIVLRPRHIEVTILVPDPASHQLAEADDDSRADMLDERADGRPQSPSLLTIPWVPVGAKARKGIAFEPAGGQSLDSVARVTLLTAIARARCWMDDLVEGRVSSFQEIAKIEGKVERHSWAEQEQNLGIS